MRDIIYQGPGGETLWREEDTLVLEFPRPRRTCSTSGLNGGIGEGMLAVFNQTCPPVDTAADLPGGSVPAYLARIAAQRGLDPRRTTGLLTAAKQENGAVSCLSFRSLTVLAVATGGVDHNGGRPGDPAAYYEENGQFYLFPGTINIMLAVNASLPPPAMLKAVITASEAKSGALLELLAPSCYSAELATGSGTDGIIIAADPEAKLVLTDAGHHAKLGELIGLTVREVVKKALALETGCTPERQLNVLARLKRFGVDEENLWRHFQGQYPGFSDQAGYRAAVQALASRADLVAAVSCVIHLADQVRWGLLPVPEAWETAHRILQAAGLGMQPQAQGPAGGAGADRAFIELVVSGFNHLVSKRVACPG